MKRLSDYKDEEALELWAEMLEPMSVIFSDKEFVKSLRGDGKKPLVIAKNLIKSHSKEVKEILLAIDDTPVDGLNIVARLVEVLTEIGQNKEILSFFGFAAQAKPVSASSGLATASTEGSAQ